MVSQFSLSIFLIICTVLVSNQVDYMRNRKLGLDKEQVVYIPIRSELVEMPVPISSSPSIICSMSGWDVTDGPTRPIRLL